MERPELRTFSGDPVAKVLADRGRYIVAVLTIVRAYIVAGCPNPCPPLASFADWSRLVRSALVWLGRTDPVKTMETARADNPSITNLRALMAAWQEVIGIDVRLTSGELRARAVGSSDIDYSLQRAILTVAASRARPAEIDPQRLGQYLSRNRGRVIAGLKILDEEDAHSKLRKWWLTRTPAQQP